MQIAKRLISILIIFSVISEKSMAVDLRDHKIAKASFRTSVLRSLWMSPKILRCHELLTNIPASSRGPNTSHDPLYSIRDLQGKITQQLKVTDINDPKTQKMQLALRNLNDLEEDRLSNDSNILQFGIEVRGEEIQKFMKSLHASSVQYDLEIAPQIQKNDTQRRIFLSNQAFNKTLKPAALALANGIFGLSLLYFDLKLLFLASILTYFPIMYSMAKEQKKFLREQKIPDFFNYFDGSYFSSQKILEEFLSTNAEIIKNKSADPSIEFYYHKRSSALPQLFHLALKENDSSDPLWGFYEDYFYNAQLTDPDLKRADIDLDENSIKKAQVADPTAFKSYTMDQFMYRDPSSQEGELVFVSYMRFYKSDRPEKKNKQKREDKATTPSYTPQWDGLGQLN